MSDIPIPLAMWVAGSAVLCLTGVVAVVCASVVYVTEHDDSQLEFIRWTSRLVVIGLVWPLALAYVTWRGVRAAITEDRRNPDDRVR